MQTDNIDAVRSETALENHVSQPGPEPDMLHTIFFSETDEDYSLPHYQMMSDEDESGGCCQCWEFFCEGLCCCCELVIAIIGR